MSVFFFLVAFPASHCGSFSILAPSQEGETTAFYFVPASSPQLRCWKWGPSHWSISDFFIVLFYSCVYLFSNTSDKINQRYILQKRCEERLRTGWTEEHNAFTARQPWLLRKCHTGTEEKGGVSLNRNMRSLGWRGSRIFIQHPWSPVFCGLIPHKPMTGVAR